MSGKSRCIIGKRALVIEFIIPDFSAIFIIPHQMDTIPHMENAKETASFPDVITEFVNSDKFPQKSDVITPKIIINPHKIFIFNLPHIHLMHNMKKRMIILT
ncbi:hypothetical protein SDC9_190547 [bioreactor metagenome]|uniref:Uncharacterized protein n=1 Tax=bioreactor metagenome TaxID=1076179 RepID=A0A645HVE1_9ZZZZ